MNNRVFLSFLLFSGLHTVVLHAQSDTVFNRFDANGLKQGYWKKYYSNGNLMYKGFFKDNKPLGEMSRYYEDGALKVLMLFTGENDCARSTLYYQNGKLAAKGNYIGTVKDSTWEYYSYYDQSIKARETYNRGMKNGFAYHFFPDGSVSEKTEWKDNMKHGIWEQYYPNKVMMIKGSYKEGRLNGPFIVSDEKGGISVRGHFLNNLRHDKWIFYKDYGTVDVEIIYNQGIPEQEDVLTEKQKEILKMIDENQGKYDEPDETNFMQRGNL
ncbi:MAG: hypothetical protein JW973_10655 [Bacteroidales bacterium]|nr:hypothetical protein [Bacteroidales bacterium]